MARTDFTLDRYTTMGDLTSLVRQMLRRWLIAIGVVLAGSALYLYLTDAVGAGAYAMIAAGTFGSLAVWSGKGIGLPLLPMIALQHLVAYGLPILTQHPDVRTYPPEMVYGAALNVIVFFGAMVGAWRTAMQVLQPSSPLCFALLGIDREGIKGLTRLGLGLVIGSTVLQVLQTAGLTNFIFTVLPSGTYPIVLAAISATSACGFFLMSMIISSAPAKPTLRAFFWTLLTLNCLISAASLLLSAAAVTVGAVAIGFWWGTGRPPVRFIVVVGVALAFLNLGKFTMRARYWQQGDDGPAASTADGFSGAAKIYAEWTQASLDTLVTPEENPMAGPPRTKVEGQSLLDRVNNLQNLLYVMDAVNRGTPPLHGATYTLIPPLLLPRIMWPDKPRSHEGQVLLNTHFGRQDLQSTFKTYIAWGLLPEAYGNFGPIAGAVALGGFLGIFFAWLENFTARKSLLSTEGFVSFVVFLGLANSYEMVASVMITSIFQSIVPVVVACMPFVHRMVVKRPDPAAE